MRNPRNNKKTKFEESKENLFYTINFVFEREYKIALVIFSFFEVKVKKKTDRFYSLQLI